MGCPTAPSHSTRGAPAGSRFPVKCWPPPPMNLSSQSCCSNLEGSHRLNRPHRLGVCVQPRCTPPSPWRCPSHCVSTRRRRMRTVRRCICFAFPPPPFPPRRRHCLCPLCPLPKRLRFHAVPRRHNGLRRGAPSLHRQQAAGLAPQPEALRLPAPGGRKTTRDAAMSPLQILSILCRLIANCGSFQVLPGTTVRSCSSPAICPVLHFPLFFLLSSLLASLFTCAFTSSLLAHRSSPPLRPPLPSNWLAYDHAACAAQTDSYRNPCSTPSPRVALILSGLPVLACDWAGSAVSSCVWTRSARHWRWSMRPATSGCSLASTP